jgi:hypothetical protein
LDDGPGRPLVVANEPAAHLKPAISKPMRAGRSSSGNLRRPTDSFLPTVIEYRR